MAKAIDYDEYDHVPRGATFVSRPAPPLVANPNGAKLALEFVTQHFAVVSAIAVLTAFILGIDFLYAYLGRFDWSLIWLVEYSDIFKVGLIVVGFLSGIALSFQSIVDVLLGDNNTTKQRVLQAGAFALVVFTLLIHAAVAYFIGGWYLALQTLSSWLLAIWALLRVHALLTAIPDISARRLIEDFLIVTFAIGVIGNTVGLTVREYKDDKYTYDVTLKNEKLEGVALVMVAAHHTILYSNEKSIAVPTAEVLKLQARPTPRTKVECVAAEAC